jgi:ATP-dependent RNA helicase SUPV3L1/SUV3
MMMLLLKRNSLFMRRMSVMMMKPTVSTMHYHNKRHKLQNKHKHPPQHHHHHHHPQLKHRQKYYEEEDDYDIDDDDADIEYKGNEHDEYDIDEIEIEVDEQYNQVTDSSTIRPKKLQKLTARTLKHYRRLLEDIYDQEKTSGKPRYKQHGITPVVFNLSWEIFSKHFMNQLVFDEDIQNAFKQKQIPDHELLFKLYLQDCMQRFPAHFSNNRMSEDMEQDLLLPTDLSKPHEWYPAARSRKRKVFVHTGPTNSGKTHKAFERLKQASSGIYCAPLRLLATEGYVKLTDNGVKCNLMTGDYQVEHKDATHTSSTVEMIDINSVVDVAVIDEIQLIGDEERGWAWTRAFLGLNANEIHVCGEERALNIIEQLCEETGDELEIQHYKRLTPLKVTAKSSIMESYKNIQSGDCVVTFSRKEVFKIKHEIEQATNLRVAVVYGALPPKVRLEQSKLYNSADAGYDVLVATDAIGMGLNLNIRRLIFHSVEKFDGTVRRQLAPYEIRQIAGRAGRYGSLYPKGEVTCLHNMDCKVLQSAFMIKQLPDIEAAGLFPPVDQIEFFTKHFSQDQPLRTTLESFYSLTETDPKYFMCNIEDRKQVAHLLHEVKDLTFKERMQFLNAPIDTANPDAMRVTKHYARHHSKGNVVPVLVTAPQSRPQTMEQLREIEATYKILETYCWLSYRFSETFTLRDEARQLQDTLLQMITMALKQPTNSAFVNNEQRSGYYLNVAAMNRRVNRDKFKNKQEALLKELQQYGIFSTQLQQQQQYNNNKKKRSRK